jgi:hypothetical protein
MPACPINRRPIDPCPRKHATGRYNECQECLDDWSERAGMAECREVSLAEAEALATRLLREAVAAAEARGTQMEIPHRRS